MFLSCAWNRWILCFHPDKEIWSKIWGLKMVSPGGLGLELCSLGTSHPVRKGGVFCMYHLAPSIPFPWQNGRWHQCLRGCQETAFSRLKMKPAILKEVIDSYRYPCVITPKRATSRICFLLDKYVWKQLSACGMRQLLLSTIFELDGSIIAFLNTLKSVSWNLAKAFRAVQ